MLVAEDLVGVLNLLEHFLSPGRVVLIFICTESPKIGRNGGSSAGAKPATSGWGRATRRCSPGCHFSACFLYANFMAESSASLSMPNTS
jgi:hypothetical protein